MLELPPSAPKTLYATRLSRDEVVRPYMSEDVRCGTHGAKGMHT